jgi:hypothetical protein
MGGPVGGRLAQVGADATNADGWAGFAYRATLNFEKGQLKSVTISGVDIPINQMGEVMSANIAAKRKSPPIIPNRGSSKIASLNDTIQLTYGQSPWKVGDSAKLRTPQGDLSVKNGSIDVHNHGNKVVAVTEPIYELGVKYGVLKPGQVITNNKQAGQVIDEVFSRASKLDQADKVAGRPFQNHHGNAAERMRNPYGLDFGSFTLKHHNTLYKKGLDQVGYQVPPKDVAFVKAAFQGNLRNPQDNPVVQPTAPSRRFGF